MKLVDCTRNDKNSDCCMKLDLQSERFDSLSLLPLPCCDGFFFVEICVSFQMTLKSFVYCGGAHLGGHYLEILLKTDLGRS